MKTTEDGFSVRFRAGFVEVSRPGFPGRVFAREVSEALDRARMCKWAQPRPKREAQQTEDEPILKGRHRVFTLAELEGEAA